MVQATTTKFRRDINKIQRQARRDPVQIMRHGRRDLVLMSAEHYDWLTAAARRIHCTTEAPPVVIDGIRRAQTSPEHAHLDELLK